MRFGPATHVEPAYSEEASADAGEEVGGAEQGGGYRGVRKQAETDEGHDCGKYRLGHKDRCLKGRVGRSFAEEVANQVSKRDTDKDEQLNHVAFAGGKTLQENREQPIEGDEHPPEKEGEAANP